MNRHRSTTTQTPWLMTVPEVATLAHRTEATVCRAIRQGQLAASDPKRGPYLITRAAVAEWLGLNVEDIRSRWSEETPGDELDGAA